MSKKTLSVKGDTVKKDEGNMSVKEREELFRKTRIPLGGNTLKLSVPKVKGYHTHWFIDVGNELHDAIQAGYQFLDSQYNPMGVGETLTGNTGLGSYINKPFDIGEGHPHTGYLMAKKQEWHDEDMAAQEAARAGVEQLIKQGKYKNEIDPAKTYVPKSGIQISN